MKMEHNKMENWKGLRHRMQIIEREGMLPIILVVPIAAAANGEKKQPG